jgi:hypothetical protein
MVPRTSQTALVALFRGRASWNGRQSIPLVSPAHLSDMEGRIRYVEAVEIGQALAAREPLGVSHLFRTFT